MDADVEEAAEGRLQCEARVGAEGPRCELWVGHAYGHTAKVTQGDGSVVSYTWGQGRLYQPDARLVGG